MNVSTRLAKYRAWVEVNLGNLIANARAVRETARGAELLPVVKADAYSLGAVRVAQALDAVDPWGFAVATVDEAMELRAAGIRRPILVLTPADLQLRAVYHEHDMRAVLDDPTVVEGWERPFHLEIDTGMGRCGVRWNVPQDIERCRSQFLEGVFTHFYAADEQPETVGTQWSRFEQALDVLGSRPALVHAANSPGVWRLHERLDLARPGVFLYGGRAAPDLPSPRPVVAVRARVVSLRSVTAGATVSYGGDWTAPEATTIATLGIGYADGVPRAVEARAHAIVGGNRHPVVGRVTMDLTMIDVGPDGGGVHVGDVATLIGSGGTDEITLDEFASWSGTIAHEALARLGPRLERMYADA